MPTALQNVSEETRDELAALALRMSSHAKTREPFLGMVKELAPGTPIPELDTKARLEHALTESDKKYGELKNSFEDFKLGQAMVENKKAVMTKHGLSPDDMTKIEERMGKKELPMDYEFAARLHKQEMEVAPPTSYGTSGHGPFSLEKNAKAFEGLMENEADWSITTAHNMIDEMQKKGHTPAF